MFTVMQVRRLRYRIRDQPNILVERDQVVKLCR